MRSQSSGLMLASRGGSDSGSDAGSCKVGIVRGEDYMFEFSGKIKVSTSLTLLRGIVLVTTNMCKLHCISNWAWRELSKRYKEVKKERHQGL